MVEIFLKVERSKRLLCLFLSLVFNFFLLPYLEASAVFFLFLRYHTERFFVGEVPSVLESLWVEVVELEGVSPLSVLLASETSSGSSRALGTVCLLVLRILAFVNESTCLKGCSRALSSAFIGTRGKFCLSRDEALAVIDRLCEPKVGGEVHSPWTMGWAGGLPSHPVRPATPTVGEVGQAVSLAAGLFPEILQFDSFNMT